MNERQKINFIINIFDHLCGLLLFYVKVVFFFSLWNNGQYYLENSYILPLQEFHIRLKLESEEIF